MMVSGKAVENGKMERQFFLPAVGNCSLMGECWVSVNYLVKSDNKECDLDLQSTSSVMR